MRMCVSLSEFRKINYSWRRAFIYPRVRCIMSKSPLHLVFSIIPLCRDSSQNSDNKLNLLSNKLWTMRPLGQPTTTEMSVKNTLLSSFLFIYLISTNDNCARDILAFISHLKTSLQLQQKSRQFHVMLPSDRRPPTAVPTCCPQMPISVRLLIKTIKHAYFNTKQRKRETEIKGSLQAYIFCSIGKKSTSSNQLTQQDWLLLQHKYLQLKYHKVLLRGTPISRSQRALHISPNNNTMVPLYVLVLVLQ